MGRKSEYEIGRNNWFEPRHCFRKFRQGEWWYLGRGVPKRQALEAARSEWSVILYRLKVLGESPKQVKQSLKRTVQFDQRTLAEIKAKIESFPSGNPLPEQVLQAIKTAVESPAVYATPANMPELFAAFRTPSDFITRGSGRTAGRLSTIAEAIDAFLKMKEAELNAGQLRNPQSYTEYRNVLTRFKQICLEAGLTEIDQLNGELLESYRRLILRLSDPAYAAECETAPIGPITQRKKLARVKTFVEWAYEAGHLQQLPRNIKSFAKIAIPNSGIAHKRAEECFYSPDEIKELYQASSEKTKLFLLLGLNAGFTQCDISELRHSDINFESGEIIKPRNKTGVPQRCKLWPETLRLLKKYRSNPSESEYVLLGKNGNQLLWYTDEQKNRIDSVALAFNRVRNKLANQKLRRENPLLYKRGHKAERIEALKLRKDPRAFKTFRKSAANEIEKHFGTGSGLASLYLAHADRRTAKHYVHADWEKLFEATEYLRTLYGF